MKKKTENKEYIGKCVKCGLKHFYGYYYKNKGFICNPCTDP